MTPVGVREFGEWCREAGIDEWKALIKIAAGSHEAAYLLHYALQWSSGETVAASDGWFYRKAEDIEADTGLNRRGLKRAVTVLQREIKLEAANRRIKLPSGDCLLKTSMHYRLDRDALFAAFGLHTMYIPELHTGGNPALQADGNPDLHTGSKAELHIVDDPRLQLDGKTESLKESFNNPSMDASKDRAGNDPVRLNAFEVYERLFEKPTERWCNELVSLIADYGDPEVTIAVEILHLRGKDTPEYLKGILQGRVDSGEVGQPAQRTKQKPRSTLDAAFFDPPTEPKNDLRLRESDDGPLFIPPPDVDEESTPVVRWLDRSPAEPKNNFRVVHGVPDASLLVFKAQPVELKAVGD